MLVLFHCDNDNDNDQPADGNNNGAAPRVVLLPAGQWATFLAWLVIAHLINSYVWNMATIEVQQPTWEMIGNGWNSCFVV